MQKFANTLTQLRQEKGITQDELAKEIGISRSAIGMYERGERRPDFETLERIADYFGVSFNFLLGSIREYEDAQNDSLELFGYRAKALNGLNNLMRFDFDDIISSFLQLNNAGLIEAAKRIKELSFIPEYKTKKEIDFTGIKTNDEFGTYTHDKYGKAIRAKKDL